METKKMKTLSMVSLIISVLPLTTLIPVFLKITLPEGVGTAWAGTNIACVVVSLIISIICVKNRESRSAVNVISTLISGFWGLLMIGIVILAMFLNIIG
jgi:hypothetical protein